MPPLALSLCIKFYLVSRIITDETFAAIVATLLLAAFLALWFLFPYLGTCKRLSRKGKD